MSVVAVLLKALVWAGAVVNMSTQALAIDVVIEALTDLMVDMGVAILADVGIIMMTAVVATVLIALEFAETAFDVLIDA